jgi:hypothetical protein
MSTVRCCINAYPEAVCEINGYGDAPIHALLANVNHFSCQPDIIRALLMANPMCAELRNAKDKLPIHLVVKHYEPCMKTVALLLQAFPQGAMLETEDEIIQLRFNSSSGSSSGGIPVSIASSSTSNAASSNNNDATTVRVRSGSLSSIPNATIVNPTLPTTPAATLPIELTMEPTSSSSSPLVHNMATAVTTTLYHTTPVTTTTSITTSSSSSSSSSERRRVIWSPYSRAMEYGNYQLLQIMDTVINMQAMRQVVCGGYQYY